MEKNNTKQTKIKEEKETNTKIEKEKRIKKEINFLNKFFKNIEKDKKNLIQNLIKKAAFMSVTLDDLQNTMNEEGVVGFYMNGENQFGTKKSPEVEIYNTMIKNFTLVIEKLYNFLPESQKDNEKAGNELLKFVMQQKVKK